MEIFLNEEEKISAFLVYQPNTLLSLTQEDIRGVNLLIQSLNKISKGHRT